MDKKQRSYKFIYAFSPVESEVVKVYTNAHLKTDFI